MGRLLADGNAKQHLVNRVERLVGQTRELGVAPENVLEIRDAFGTTLEIGPFDKLWI